MRAARGVSERESSPCCSLTDDEIQDKNGLVRKGKRGAVGVIPLARVLFIEVGDEERVPGAVGRDVSEAIP